MIAELEWHVIAGLVVGGFIGALLLQSVGRKTFGIALVMGLIVAAVHDLSFLKQLFDSRSVAEVNGWMLSLWVLLMTGIWALIGCVVGGWIVRWARRRRMRRLNR